ncbi:MAG: hypothetical protein M3Z64_01115 [Verrucomicrobiota bacterium]|nr:hypothetical protein [Verrucomicrobiota bacterium]
MNESAGVATLGVTATRLGDASEQITVTYTTRDGSATAPGDYATTTGTVTFNAGETYKQITVPINNDTQLENAEKFFVDLSNPANATVNSSKGTATVTIADDDSGASTFQFSSATYLVNEGAGSVVITVVRSGGLQLVASVNYATSDGTAVAGSDYTSASGTLTFNSGETSKTFTVPITDDAFVEGNETFNAALNTPSFGAALGAQNTTIVTITDNDGGSTIRFNPTAYTVNEAAGAVVLTVTADRLGDPSTQLTVSYITRDGSAIAGQDYSASSGTIIFNAGETQKQIAVPITNDSTLENAENFFVDLRNPGNASLAANSSTATVTIADDDSGTSRIEFNASNYSVNEDGVSQVLTVVRSGGIGLAVTINYATADGTAMAGSDYTAVSGTLSFAPGETQKTFSVPITDDAAVEGNEMFSALLSNPSAGAAVGNQNSAVVTIVDNDGGGSTVQFEPTAYSAKETPGNSTVSLTITAMRLGDPGATISASYSTSDGTAKAGSDYVAANGTVTFGPGETQKTIAITVLDDALVENGENFFVTVTGATGASIGKNSTATVTIADDDSPTASIGFSARSYDVDEGAGAVSLTVTRSGGLGFIATVNYETKDGTALAGRNYVAASGTLTFAPGETSKTINVSIIDEGNVDSTLNFTVTLTDPNGTGFVGGQSTATVNILDNDANTFRLRSSTYTVNERGGSVILTVDVQRSGSAAEELSVDYVTTDGTAQAGSKYTRTAGRLTFGANVTSQTITVPILDEPFIEGSTYFNVVLSNPLPARTDNGTTASRLGSPSSAVVTIIDDDARTFQFGSSNYGLANSSGVANVTVTFSRAADPTGTYRVDYATSDGTAVAGRDYARSSGTLTFQPDETSKTIAIQIAQQPAGQPTRQFQISLSNPSSGAVIGPPSVATITITNPDFSTKLLNISTRGPVRSGDDVMIAGFIIRGGSAKTLVLRGLGPSLTSFGVADAIADPTLTLTDANGTQLAYDDDYRTDSAADQQTLDANGLTPNDSHEAALVTSLGAGGYTAILRGKTNGVALVEVYDITGTISTDLVNISTRGKVEHGDNGAMIAGFIVAAPENQPGVPQRVVVRAIGPSLKNYGVNDALADSTLELYHGSEKILQNDNWKSNSTLDQQALQSFGLAPASDKEAALITTLDPGSYTAVIRGKNDITGVALAEIYRVDQ